MQKLRWFYQLGYSLLHMKTISLLLILSLLACVLEPINASVSIPGTGEFTPTNDVNTHTYSYTGGGNNVARFQLTFPTASDVGQIIMWAGSIPTINDKKLSSYQHFFPTANTSYDLQDVNMGKRQIVEVYMGPGSSMMTIYVLNLNRYDSLNYSITGSEAPAYSTSYCAAGNTPLPNSIYCSSCDNSNYVGAYCNIVNQRTENGITYTLQLYGLGDSRGNFGTFTIPGSNSKILLYFKSSDVNIFNFIQFKTRDGDVAGLINYAPNGGYNALTQPNTQYTIGITSSGTDVSVSFLNLNSGQVNLNVWYNLESTSDILMIILAVLGAVLFVGLVIVAICIVKKMNNSTQMVHPRGSQIANNQRNNNENNLSAEQIQIYFPTVLTKNVFGQEQLSSMNLMNKDNNNNNNNIDRDCVICLCPVGPNDKMKILYCNHVFHDHCLTEWFKKNRNCPYCRQEFNKKATIDHYQSLLKSSKKNVLMGVDLVSEIIHSKQVKSSVLIQQIKD